MKILFFLVLTGLTVALGQSLRDEGVSKQESQNVIIPPVNRDADPALVLNDLEEDEGPLGGDDDDEDLEDMNEMLQVDEEVAVDAEEVDDDEVSNDLERKPGMKKKWQKKNRRKQMRVQGRKASRKIAKYMRKHDIDDISKVPKKKVQGHLRKMKNKPKRKVHKKVTIRVQKKLVKGKKPNKKSNIGIACRRVQKLQGKKYVSKVLSKLNPEEAEKWKQIYEDRRNQMSQCCEIAEAEDRETCVNDLRRKRFDKICNNTESFGPMKMKKPQQKMVDTCCQLEGNDRYECFTRKGRNPARRNPGTKQEAVPETALPQQLDENDVRSKQSVADDMKMMDRMMGDEPAADSDPAAEEEEMTKQQRKQQRQQRRQEKQNREGQNMTREEKQEQKQLKKERKQERKQRKQERKQQGGSEEEGQNSKKQERKEKRKQKKQNRENSDPQGDEGRNMTREERKERRRQRKQNRGDNSDRQEKRALKKKCCDAGKAGAAGIQPQELQQQCADKAQTYRDLEQQSKYCMKIFKKCCIKQGTTPAPGE